MIETIKNQMTYNYGLCDLHLSQPECTAYSGVYNEQFQSVAFLRSYFIKQNIKDLVLRLFALTLSANIHHLIYFLSFVV